MFVIWGHHATRTIVRGATNMESRPPAFCRLPRNYGTKQSEEDQRILRRLQISTPLSRFTRSAGGDCRRRQLSGIP